MCRLFGLLGNARSPADPWLLASDRSLLLQSNASPATAQPDGWGVAWYADGRTPRVEKGVHGAFEEAEAFAAAARSARGPVVLAHLRRASNPTGLPHARLLGRENSQPFQYRNLLFVHNGSIPYPAETRGLLGAFEADVRGVNDSEVLFWLLTRHVEELGDPLAAYARTVDDLLRVAAERGRPDVPAYSGLNVLLARGPQELWAFCLSLGDHGPGLLDPARPYYALAYVADAKQLVVGSEPFDSTRPDWRTLANGEYLVARVVQGLVTVETGRIPLAHPAAPLRVAGPRGPAAA